MGLTNLTILPAPGYGGAARTIFVGAASLGYGTGQTGQSTEMRLPTLLAALDATKVDPLDRGTDIVLARNHAEVVSAADFFSAIGARKNIRIISEGEGVQRASITWTAAAATWLLDTDGVAIENCRLFLAGPHAAGTAVTVAAPITVSGAGCAIRRCQIFFGFDADQIVTVGIQTTAAGDDFAFEDNQCYGNVAAEITAAGTFLRLIGADRVSIKRNYIAGALATDTDGLIETLTTPSLNVDITDNFIYANGAGNTCAIDAGADLANTGRLARNLLVVDADGTAETVVFTKHANSNLALLDNFLVNNNNERGLVIGTASA
jgi:hypothetical protein